MAYLVIVSCFDAFITGVPAVLCSIFPSAILHGKTHEAAPLTHSKTNSPQPHRQQNSSPFQTLPHVANLGARSWRFSPARSGPSSQEVLTLQRDTVFPSPLGRILSIQQRAPSSPFPSHRGAMVAFHHHSCHRIPCPLASLSLLEEG